MLAPGYLGRQRAIDALKRSITTRLLKCLMLWFSKKGRRDATVAYGADVRVVQGNYDDAVRKAAEYAALNGWQIVSDTAYVGYTEIPRDVMQGYGVVMEEVFE
ncbi:threonine dehydratase [Bradyrhizobium sp. BR13661]|nr:threonine dehydratase [Bradyrhizobium sp. BR13661]